ncbi:MAG: rhamnogalacturonan acetylesterase [Lachnospira sp.]|nr:rhamnogalacturonan acetylesterase [Lachnospira sp.]
MKTANKPTVFLVSDSTVQSYPRSMAPQCGWGQMLVKYMTTGAYSVYHSEHSSFPNAVTYETDTVKIDNRAMAGRGARNYLAEGRFDDCLAAMRRDDWLLIQFGHNDAYKAKPERFCEPETFKKILWESYVVPARERGVHTVLVTPIAMREFDGDNVCRPSFDGYRRAMLSLGEEEGIPVIDLGSLTAQFNTKSGPEKCKALYMWVPAGVFEGWPDGDQDNAHLQYGGAYLYAGILARALARVPGFPSDVLKNDAKTATRADTAFFR